MTAYIVRRLLISIPLLLVMSLVTFGIIRLPKGDVLAPYRADHRFSRSELQRMEHEYRFDRSFIVQYGFWMKNLFLEWPSEAEQAAPKAGFSGWLKGWAPKRIRLDLGYSFVHKQPVFNVISGRLGNTLLLSVASLILVWAVAVPVGTYCAVHQYSLGDKILSFISFIGMSLPSFFLALLLLYLVSLTGWLPIGGLTSDDFDMMTFAGKIIDLAKHMVVPIIVIVTGSLAGMQRLMRGNMLEVLRMQYVTTARAKGLPESRVINRHALRNAINPMVTIFGYEFSGLLSGVALTEIITSYPGLGSLMLEAVQSQDIFLVMSSLMISGVMLIMGNLIADVLLAIADPRISYD